MSMIDRGNRSIGELLVQGAGISIAVRVVGIALSYAANVLLSRTLGVDAYGEYVIALSWALTLTLPAKAGFDNSALRYSTIYLEKGDFAAFRGFVQIAALTIAVVSLIIGALIWAVGGQFVPVDTATRNWAALLVLPLALLIFFSVVMRTAGRIVSSQFFEQILRPGLIIVGVAAAFVGGRQLAPAGAMALTVFAASIALVAILVGTQRTFRHARAHTPRYDEWRQWLAVSVPMLLMGVVQELMNQVDIILLGQMADAKQAALFAASWRLASLVPFALVGLATMGAPLIAAAYERGSLDELHRVSKIVARLSLLFAVISALLLYALGKPLLGLFGPGFAAADGVLSILLIGGVVNAFTGVVSYYATMTGRERQALVIFAGALALSIVLNVLLIPAFGAVGAAVASSSATAAWNLALLVYVRRTIGIDASAVALPPRRPNDDARARVA
jgi:O-antigen/teichoic acid export membrane protein